MCGALHELQSCSLTSGRSGGVLHVSWTCSQPCGARGAAVHASGAMRSDTRAATNLKLIGWCLLYKDHDPFSFHSSIPFKSKLKKWVRERERSRKRNFSTDFKSAPREGSGQLKINQLKINSDGKQVNVVREREKESFHGFRSVEVLLDTPPKCPKNCPAAKGDSVQISLSRRVSFFMMKPRLCPSQDQSSPVQSRRPLGFGQVLYDQPAASRLEHYSFSAGGWTIWVTVALGKDDRIAWCWTLGPPLSSEDRYSTEKASSIQSAILYDCDAEALSNSIRPSQSYSPTIKWRCCPRLVQFHGFRSVEVLLDTPPKCPKNCPAAKGDSVQISLSRRVSFFMMKPRLCPRQDQSSPVQSRRPLGFGQVLYDQPAASRLEHCELVPVIFKDSFSAGGWTIWVTVLTLSPKSGLGTGLGLMFPLLEARSWQEAKSNLVTVALGKDDRIAWCWTLGPPVRVAKPYALTQRTSRGVKVCDSDRIIPNPSRSASGPWCWVGRSVMFLFDCWLAGWLIHL
ncbi:hypothetical protein IGI04_042281 [Brassica rapa subsp. trilocularis]|uniref:Uncharacterized protein n=2 Tax=Brassica campestris TaxID=3711 RepID=A0ABQ7KJT1_BRACM|nr:hypothetical protein IGI04_042281 [Brassica rapa subsp. trilocularis]